MTPTPEIEKLAEYLEDNTGLWNHKPGSTSNLDVVQVARLIISREAKLREEIEREHENFLAVHRDNMRAVDRISTLKEKLAKAEAGLTIAIGLVECHCAGDFVCGKHQFIKSIGGAE